MSTNFFKKSKARIVAAVGLVLVALLGVWFATHNRVERDMHADEQAEAVSNRSDTPAMSSVAVEGMAFDLRYDLLIEQHDLSVPGKTLNSKYEQRGLLLVRVLADSGPIRFLGMQMHQAECAMNGHGLPEMGGLFQMPVVAAVGADGRIFQLATPRNLPPQDASRLTDFYRLFQWVDKPTGHAGGNSWPSEEADEMGTYLAEYSTMQDGTVAKRKARYAKLSEAYRGLADGFSVTVDASRFVGEKDPKKGWLARFEGEEKRPVLQHGAPRIGMLVNVDLHSRAMPAGLDAWVLNWSGKSDDLLMDLARYDTGRTKDTLAALEQDRLAELRKRYAGVAPTTLIDGIKKIAGSSDEHAATIPAIHALRDYLLAYPEAVSGVVDLLLSGRFDNGVSGRILQAVALTGHAEAQAGLARAMSAAELPPFQRVQAIVSTGDLNEANDALLETLWGLTAVAQEAPHPDLVVRASLLALGAQADSDRQAERVERADKAVSRLRTELAAGVDDREAILLLALANASVPPDDAVYARLTHRKEPVREAAVRNLAAGNTTTDRERLAEMLRTDVSTSIREAALESLVVQDDAQVLGIVAQSLSGEINPELRIRQVVYLGEHLDKKEGVDALEKQLALEPVPEVRKSIHRVLVGQQHVEF